MFVGARDLSKLLKKSEILNITEDYLGRNSEIIPPVDHSSESDTPGNRVIEANVVYKNHCPTCLL
jgi:hypothetical protein